MSEELQAIIRQTKKIRDSKQDLDQEEKLLWDRFFEICDDIAGDQQNYRFTDPELGLFIAREMHQAAPKLKIDELQKDLTPEQWKLCTRQEQVFNIDRLEVAVASGGINGDRVVNATEFYEPVPHKKFGAATRKDLE